MHRNIKLMALFNFFTDLDFLAPVAIIYFAKVAGSYALGMSVFSWAFISSALFEVPTGIFSDKIGRKKTVICGTLSSITSAVFVAIATNYWLLVIAAVFAGLARSFYSGNNEALIYETLVETKQEEKYHHFLGKLSSVFQLALATSAILGSVLAVWSFQLVAWITLFPNIARFITSIFLIEPRVHSKRDTNVFAHLAEALRLFKINRKLRLLSIVSSIRFSLGESAYLFRSVFVNTIWPLWAVGFSNFLSNIGAASSYFFSGKLIDKFNSYRILTFEIVFNRIVNLTALFFPSIISPALMGSTSLAWGVSDIALKNLSQREVSQTERATMGSLGALLHHVGFGVTSFGVGIIADIMGPVKTLILVHTLLLVPLWFYRQIFTHEKSR